MPLRSRLRHLADRVTGRAAVARFQVLERALRKSAEMHEVHAEKLQSVQSTLAQLNDRSESHASKEAAALRELREAVRALGARMARHEDPLFAEGRRYLRRELAKMASSDLPIVIGPWTGEVGFELLYWIPFVRWARAEFGIDLRRTTVISRGGVASWYGVPLDQYADVFDVIAPEEFRTASTERPSLKQRERGELDRRIVDAVARQRGLGDAKVLYPGMMFRAFRQYWEDEAGYGRIEEFTKHALLDPPHASRPPGLPSDYIAVRFYFRRSFPDTPRNRLFAETVVSGLAQTAPVVVLASGVRVDDHRDWEVADHGRGVTVFRDAPAERNLELQSAIVSGARAFVGTYGGFSYLAPLYGVPAVAFYSRRAFEGNHLYVAERVFDRIGAARLTTVDISQADLVGSALQTLSGAAPGGGA